MIFYLATREQGFTVGDYLKSWGSSMAPLLKILAYEALPTILPRGTYIFSDLERLTSAQVAIAGEIWEQLSQAGDGIRLLNDPRRALRRYELLRTLHEAGLNRFAVYKAMAHDIPFRFPVFLRRESEHTANLTPLLRSEEEVDRAIVQAVMRGVEPRDLLIVEFCDTSADGQEFRKYSAFRVGDRIIPRHLIFGHNWVLKYPDLLDPDKLAEERRYLEENPHEEALGHIFEVAQIEYGRIDYGVLDGHLQVWEINTNPIVMLPREKYRREHLPAQEHFARQIRAAFEAITSGAQAGSMVPIKLTARILERLGASTQG